MAARIARFCPHGHDKEAPAGSYYSFKRVKGKRVRTRHCAQCDRDRRRTTVRIVHCPGCKIVLRVMLKKFSRVKISKRSFKNATTASGITRLGRTDR